MLFRFLLSTFTSVVFPSPFKYHGCVCPRGVSLLVGRSAKRAFNWCLVVDTQTQLQLDKQFLFFFFINWFLKDFLHRRKKMTDTVEEWILDLREHKIQ